jgi:broad specificity phosphatase PhoE
MRIIYLVRHGTYDNPKNILTGRLPLPLNEEGKQQAKKLQEYFKDKEIAKIYSSAVMRCKQTTEIIAGTTVPIVYDKRILESFSAYQGMWYEGKPSWKDFFQHRDELGGEGYIEIQSRMMDFFNKVVLTETGNLIICSHSDPLWCLYLGILNRPLTDELEELGENGNPEYLQKGSIQPVTIENGQYTALAIIHQTDL